MNHHFGSLDYRPAPMLLAVGLGAALLAGGCGGTTAAPAAQPPRSPAPQTAPESARVDRAEPSFSNPTSITHPLFPISDLTQVVQLGAEAGAALRHEITLLPTTKVIEWNGRPVETRVSQFVAYQEGHLLEVALDYFAQANDGSVWYFGEHVDNYVDGVIDNHDGTWIAGTDGPPGMIMPADPRVGDVYRPENIPGLVFEEVTVRAIDQGVDGPRGPVAGAVVVEELLMDGTLEDKTFAPGYGEFLAQVVSEDEFVTVALAVPTDAAPGPVPGELAALSAGAAEIFEAAGTGWWDDASATVEGITKAWDAYQATGVPPLLEPPFTDALDALATAVGAREADAARQSAINIAHAGLDLELRHRPPAEVDLARLDVLTRQLLLDADAGDSVAVTGDVATLETVWNRLAHTAADPTAVDAALTQLRTATDDGGDVTTAATALQATLR